MASRRGNTTNTFGNKTSPVTPKHLPMETEAVEQVAEIVEKQVAEQSKAPKNTAEGIKKPATKKAVQKEESLDDLFTPKRGEKGKNKSIYFEKDVYEYCQQLADKYNASFNHVVNRLLRASMDKHKEQ